MRFFTNEVKIAIVAIVGIVLMFFGLNFLKGTPLFSNDSSYYIRFNDISGLTASNPIFANGYQVGVVKEIMYDYTGRNGVVVKFDVDKNLRLPQGTTAEIESDLMGNVKMNLMFSPASKALLAPGDTLSGSVNEGMAGVAAKLMPTVEKMLPKMDSILTSVNALVADPALTVSLHNMQTISTDLKTTTAGLNTLLADVNRHMPGMVNKAERSLDKMAVTLDNAAFLTGKLAEVDIESTMKQVNTTLSQLQSVTARLNSNNGSLGLLINDPGLYHGLHSTLRSADSLLTDMKAHPKRYVHFSLFGKKDK